MNKKGGYQIIDLKDFNFTEENNIANIFYLKNPNEYTDIIYDVILGKNCKGILLSNIVINGVEKNDVFLSCNNLISATPDNIMFIVYNHQCYIGHVTNEYITFKMAF